MTATTQSNVRSSGSRLVRGAGVLAVAGGLMNAVSDYYLQGGLIARSAVNTYQHLPQAPYDMVFVGSLIGNAVLPLWLFGFLPVYLALRPAGRWLSVPPTLLLGYMFCLFPGYHGAYALYAAGFQAEASAQSASFATLTERLHAYHDALVSIIGVAGVVGGVWLIVAMLSGRTRFPRWMVIFSPLVVPLTQPLVEMLPAPLGGFIRPAWGSLLFTLFFVMATVVSRDVRLDLKTSDPALKNS